MNPQTLKGKVVEVKVGCVSQFGHLDRDIARAIEWLKLDIYKQDNDIPNWIMDSIDEAFEGVQK